MSGSFEWEFDTEEAAAPHEVDVRHGPLSRGRRRRVWAAVLLAAFILGGAGAYVWVQNRLKAADLLAAELRASVELELEAMAAGDIELFFARLDPSDSRWQVRQLARYSLVSAAEGFSPAPGLVASDQPPTVRQVEISSGLGRVELVHWYQPRVQGPNEAAPLPFQLTWFYRQDDDGAWYHVSPPDSYQTTAYIWRGSRLAIRATQAEAKFLEPIAALLDDLIVESCKLLDCPRDGHNILTFKDVLVPRIQGNRWSLPTLRLTGMPEGQESQTAWEQALSVWLVATLIRTNLERQGVMDPAIYRELASRLQTRIGTRGAESLEAAPLADMATDVEGLTPQDPSPAEEAFGGPDRQRSAEAEVSALMRLLALQASSEHLFDLMPAMTRNPQIDPFLLSHYRLDPHDMQDAWLAYLSELTGAPITPESGRARAPEPAGALLKPPPLPDVPSLQPGDEMALVCDNQVWVGNLDGSGVVPLTHGRRRFSGVHWSPDGRWLLTTWRHSAVRRLGALYLVNPAGGEAHLLTKESGDYAWTAGWGPDGRTTYYLRDADADRGVGLIETWAMDVQTQETRRLPSLPAWSPDGTRAVYLDEAEEGRSNTLWLADATHGPTGIEKGTGAPLGQWTNAREIAHGVAAVSEESWSNDGSKLALSLDSGTPGDRAIAIYNVDLGTLVPVITLADLISQAQPYTGELLPSDGLREAFVDTALTRLVVGGWSSDGNKLLIGATGEPTGGIFLGPAALFLLPLNGTTPRVLAYSEAYGELLNVAWSPADPELFAVSWRPGWEQDPSSYLFDLRFGPIFTSAGSWNSTWSPDGARLVFAGPNQIIVVDQNGQVRTILRHDHYCSLPVWNPSVDVALDEPVCSEGFDLRLSDQDVYQVGDDLLLHVHNDGVQAARNVPMRVVDGVGSRFESIGLGNVPACGSLLVRLAERDWSSPLTVHLNLPDEPGALVETDYGDNQITVELE
jgi:Tol biopolymer transport system component